LLKNWRTTRKDRKAAVANVPSHCKQPWGTNGMLAIPPTAKKGVKMAMRMSAPRLRGSMPNVTKEF
jgi:hypothetical protein